MFFLLRAGLCIGVIILLIEGVDIARLVSAPETTTIAASAAGPLQAFCRTRPQDCAAALKTAVSALPRNPPSAH